MSETSAPVETVVTARVRELAGFEIRRALPTSQRRALGPFVFLDQMGPLVLHDARQLEVLAHPHIGLATVTYLYSGALTHRDSLGSCQVILPGEVNWMTAGRGIAHSERSSDAGNPPGGEMFGLQTWVALRREQEECPPAFAHHEAAELPALDADGVRGRLVLGSGWGLRSPVAAESDPFFADCRLTAGARLALPAAVEERGAYVLAGRVRVGEAVFEPGTLVAFRGGSEVVLAADTEVHVALLGGATLDGPRHIWWNFVASSRERIEAAKADWRALRFAPVPGESERIPLPE